MPSATRPYMPGYQIAKGAKGQKSWVWAQRRFTASHNYWVTTVHPGGRPNSTAVWGLWLDGKFWFSCAANSRKAKNIAKNPHVSITTERADEAVIIEGTAKAVRASSLV